MSANRSTVLNCQQRLLYYLPVDKSSKGDDESSPSSEQSEDLKPSGDGYTSKGSKGSKGGDGEKRPKGDDDDSKSKDEDSKSEHDDDDDSEDEDEDTKSEDDDDEDSESEDDDDEDDETEDDDEGDKTEEDDDDEDDETEGEDDKPAPSPTKKPSAPASSPTKKPSLPASSPTEKPSPPPASPTKKPSPPPASSPTEKPSLPASSPTTKPSDEPRTCVGDGACEDAHFLSLGDMSCIGDGACAKVVDGDFGENSCQGENACVGAIEAEVGDGSCICANASGCKGEGACGDVDDSVIGNNSCAGRSACSRIKETIIGSGSCNCDDCCEDLPSGCVIPDNECNDEDQGCSDTCPDFGPSSKECQEPITTFSSLSDGLLARVADNFIPEATGSVNKVTFYGSYVDSGEPVVGSSTPDDHIKITYYKDDGSGIPGDVVAGPFIQDDEDVPLTVTGPEETDELIDDESAMYEYKASHPPVPVEAGQQYWIEIVNVSDGTSLWFWVPSLDGDERSVVDTPLDGWDSSDVEEGYDLAFCLNVPFYTENRRFWEEDMKRIDVKNDIKSFLDA